MNLAALLAAVAALAGGPAQVVHPDGRVGQFRIGVTTKAQLLTALGAPRKTVAVTNKSGARVAVRLAYSCGAGCDTVYSFREPAGRLADFASASHAYLTEHGAHVGMSSLLAAELEGKPAVKACGNGKAIHVRRDATHDLALAVLGGRVTILAYLGPHSTYGKAFC
jgi:hypothetical protein